MKNMSNEEEVCCSQIEDPGKENQIKTGIGKNLILAEIVVS